MQEKQVTISWTPEMLRRFKERYEAELEAGKDSKDTFIFDGNVFILGYAKYLIQYLEDQF